jgi:xylulokinase/glycerol kinase
MIEIAKNISQKAQVSGIEINAITLTSQRSSLIPVNKFGKPLHNAIMWQDKRTASICEEFSEKEEYVYKITGSKISPIFTAPKMTWLKRNLPDIYNNTYKLVTIHDYVLFLLTGDFITDHSIASRSLLFNIETLQWDDNLVKLFEVDSSKLCKIVEPGSICGYITEEISKITGIKTGTPVITAGGDQQCALLGYNITSHGKMVVNTGTGSYIIACSDKPQIDRQMRITCNISAIPGKYILETSVPTTGTVYRWFNENFYKDIPGQEHIFQKINEDAIDSTLGSNDLIMLPNFDGKHCKKNNPFLKGMFFNISLGTKRCDFARAILEGITYEIEKNIKVLQEYVGDVEEVNTSGGLTSFDFFNQLQADVYKKKVICNENEEASTLGAWMSAAKRIGIFTNYDEAFYNATEKSKSKVFKINPENAAQYDRLKHQRNSFCSAFSGID